MTKAILPALSDPESTADAAIELFGDEAATAVAHCGLDAWTDGRADDFAFWSTFSVV
ncbi:hypothetical protein PYH37_006370 (plasmid) [Sinorhizobium numidicum]|uniref:Transposase n=1 Tax=Sinorhizobium numidicum TaxID=680248 RepID=A0ABY8D913_9HYPH|nr:hypothetical protein [Sinorhizobium numidicum]WEX79458.1 hypothetical protein PYH37_006370 [Sinorhizobium numidicum]WEX85586.1 hypothetical protein PYH38_006014 [Sinorhizobium numidicum]